jgi:hypothetical protein
VRALEKLNEPTVLADRAAEWTQEYLAELAAGRKPRSRWGHPEIRQVLRDEIMAKCAYCEAYIEHVSFGEVEHIIPKSIKPELVYRWQNLTGACRRCNGAKGNFFDSENGLLNPYVDDIDAHLLFLGSLIYPRLSMVRGEISIAKLKLNRLDLSEQRKRRLEAVNQVLERWHASDGVQRELLADGLRLDAREGEFTGAVTAFLSSFEFPI